MNRFLPFEAIAAFRFMRSGLMQTSLIIIGVAVGVAVIVFMSALLSGLQSNLFTRTLNSVAQIVISPPQEAARALRSDAEARNAALVQPKAQRLRSIDQWQKVREQVQGTRDVTDVAPIVSGPGFAARGDASNAISLAGIEVESYTRITPLADKLVTGQLKVDGTDIMIGIELAKDLGAVVGDKLRVTTAKGTSLTLTVTATLDFGNKTVNQRNTYVALRVAQSLLDLSGGVSTINVNVRDPFAAEEVAQRIQAETGLLAESWIRTNAQFFTALAAQKMSSVLIRVFVGLTVALGIASVLVVSVVQKSKEIGILRAMGTTRGQVLRLFLLQGAVMGLTGSLAGSFLGWLFLQAWRSIARNPDGTVMFIIEMPPALFMVAAAGATLVGTLAAVMPARRAARLDPAVAIRG
jgi:lipoprotein-releasing system permease protein